MKQPLTLFSSLRLLVLIAGLSLFQNNAHGACAWYVQDGNPWSQNFNITAMDNVYGAGNWTQNTYAQATTNVATIFSAASCLVFLEGSDQNAIALNNYLLANITVIENWVTAGGRLFINAAPNQGGNISYGFGGTLNHYGTGQTFYTDAVAVTVTNPIFLGPYLPTATAYTGNYFAHTYLDGTGLTDLLEGTANVQGNPSASVCSDKLWGTGIAFFGTMTQPNWWQPQPQAANLWYNILYYVATIQLNSITTTIPLNSYCGGQSFTVSYNATGITFVGGNVFNVELSDGAGSFAAPVTIGSLTTAATSGTINCTIPITTPTATGYRIRTVSTSPAYTGANNGTDITITVPVTPTNAITASPGNAVCTNTPVTFTSAYTGGGTTPTFQWYVNNIPVGTNSPSYSYAGLQNNDFVDMVMTSSAVCAIPVSLPSNYITMTVADPSTPSIFIYADPGDTVCQGTLVKFHVVTQHGGPTPVYQWTKNGNPIGGNTTTLLDTALAEGDVIQCTLTSSAACVTSIAVSSNSLTTHFVNSGFLSGNISYPTLRQIIMAGYNYIVSDNECNLIATVSPVGANPIVGNTNVSVSLSYAENTYNGQPYVKRHFDIYPDTNEETATANITLYAYQSEFTSYNILADGWGFPPLPRDSNDVADYANVRITQFHGIGNVPANYPGPVEIKTPTSVTWDATYHWWVITFPVTGFSGFYIHTVNVDHPLSVTNTTGSDFAFHAYPNPVENTLTVNVSGTRNGDSYLSLTDATGKLIQKVKVTDNTTQINMSALASGLYFIKYNDDTRSESIKVTKQ